MGCNQIIDVKAIPKNAGIYIGVWDTLNVRSQQFDISAWQTAYGPGQLVIIHQRPGDDLPYEVAGVEIADGVATWTFDETDSGVAGYGSAALAYFVGDEYKARTVPIQTYIAVTIGMTGTETPPDPWEDWYTRVLQASADAQQAAEDAAGSASDADDSAKDAADSATAADGSAKDAKDSADAADGFASAASGSADSAAADALKSEGYALGTQNGTPVASGSPYYHQNAKYMKDEAAGSAFDALGYSELARDWADFGDAGSPSAVKNAKYFADQAEADALAAEGWADGTQDGTPVGSGSPYYENNAKYYADAAAASAATFDTDPTLTIAGKAADAKVAGDRILAAFPQESVADADVITFPDGADGIPMKSLVVTIPVAQEGSGTPAPDNVRPFVGYTGLTVTRDGKNLFDEANATSASSKAYNLSTGELENSNNVTAFTSYVPVLPGKAYTISLYKIATTYSMTRVIYYDANKQFISGEGVISSTNTAGYKSGTFTTPSNAAYIRFSTSAGHRELQMEYGSERTAYEEYAAPLVCPVNWTDEAGTIYGGTLDVVTGVLSTRWAKVDLASLTWTYDSTYLYQKSTSLYNNSNFKRIATITNGTNPSDIAKAEKYAPVTQNEMGNSHPKNSFSVSATGNISFVNAEGHESETPSGMFVYRYLSSLASTEYQLTPQQVISLLGYNTIWSDVGTVAATYRADPKMYVDAQIAAVMAAIANL